MNCIKKGIAIKGYDTVAYFADGKLYLNYSRGIQKKWLKDQAALITAADAESPKLIGELKD